MKFLLFSKFSAAIFFLPFFKLKVYGKEYLTDIKGPILIVSNHTSFWDGILMQYLFFYKKISFIAKSKIISNNRILSKFLSLYGVVTVKSTDKSINVLNRMIDLIKVGENVAIFPEGRISKDLQPFKKGAAYVAKQTDVTVVPMHISGTYGIFKRVLVKLDKPFKVSDLHLEESIDLTQVNTINTILYDKIKKLSTEE